MWEQEGGRYMTAVIGPDVDVKVATHDDTKKAIANALRRAGGVSFDELAEQARTGSYTSTKARLAWMAIGDLHGIEL